jgi:hypothetical protein
MNTTCLLILLTLLILLQPLIITRLPILLTANTATTPLSLHYFYRFFTLLINTATKTIIALLLKILTANTATTITNIIITLLLILLHCFYCYYCFYNYHYTPAYTITLLLPLLPLSLHVR